MYQEFSVLAIEPILNEKKIVIRTNRDINEYSMKDTVIEVFERSTKTPVLFTAEVKDRDLEIVLREWPIPNTEYVLSVKGLKSITDEDLSANIKKRIIFESIILSKAVILSPSMFERVDDTLIELKEIAKSEDELKGSFYIEVATDNAFYNVVAKSAINKTVFRLSLTKHKQYFVRARIQTNDGTLQYGEWSETIAFIYGDENMSGDIPPIEEPDDPDNDIDTPDDDGPIVDLEDFEIINSLNQGVTPDNLLIEFSKEIDPFSIDNIIVIRREVK